ncbi:MAG: hypothetical protein WBE09_06515, partial [Candidatus Acidiferrales bacterium]
NISRAITRCAASCAVSRLLSAASIPPLGEYLQCFQPAPGRARRGALSVLVTCTKSVCFDPTKRQQKPFSTLI